MRVFCLIVMLALLGFRPALGAGEPPRGWSLEGTADARAFDTGTEAVPGAASAHSAFIRSGTSARGSAGLVQRFSAVDYAGKRVRLAGALKTLDATDARMFISVIVNNTVFDYHDAVSLHGTNDWKSYDAVIDVPADADLIKIGFSLAGKGTVWVDGLSFAPVGGEVPVTASWGGSGAAENYDFGMVDGPGGVPVAHIKPRFGAPHGKFFSRTQCIGAEAYRGGRLQLSGRLKTDDVLAAQMWMRVDGAGLQVLEFDNMSDGKITGTNDWERYDIVLDVPPASARICYGFFLAGGWGEVWADDLALKPVAKDVPVTAMSEVVYRDFNYNPKGGYGVASDADGPDGRALHIQADPDAGRYANFAMSRCIGADGHRGQRLRFAGRLKTAQVGYADLWMRVDLVGSPSRLSYMAPHQIRGTGDWARYDTVLDVPSSAARICYGLNVAGGGDAWAEGLVLDLVGNDVRETRWFAQDPIPYDPYD
jgi:hypothetical protein